MEREQSLEKRFVVDSMLGKVAKWLRVLGFDTRYERFRDRSQLENYLEEGRIPITRNQRWCNADKLLCLTSNDPMEQLREVITLTPISPDEIRPLRRCIVCNQLLEGRTRREVFGRVPDYVFETVTSFYQCPKCEKIYWPGSHPSRMRAQLQQLLGWRVERWIS